MNENASGNDEHGTETLNTLELTENIINNAGLYLNQCSENAHNTSSESLYVSSSDEYVCESDTEESSDIEGQNKTDNSMKNGKRGGRKKTEKKFRKRVRNEKSWKRNVRKKAKDEGKEYISVTGKTKPTKVLRSACACRMKCNEKISEDNRKYLFEAFYTLPVESQNQYLSDSVEEFEKKTQRIRDNKSDSRRNFSRKYFLKIQDRTEKVEVCQTMFVNTFSITLMKIRVIVEKRRKSGTNMCPPDGRGKHGNQIKLSAQAKQNVMNHIKLFPAYESHYSRNRSEKKYLRSDLNISKMYCLYRIYCNEKYITDIASEVMYRKIFVEEFNLSFHQPKNDTCEKCDKFKLILQTCSSDEEKTIMKERDAHMQLAESSYDEKKKDKEKSLNDPNCAFLSFDLEKCLPTPCLNNNLSFYKRSLWTFNLTFYSVINQERVAGCYIWDETIAQRGGAEIASCIRQHLLRLPEHITEVNLFSDSCTAQNRNIQVAVMFLHFLAVDVANNSTMNLNIINQKFLQPGHTHLEADTIHAAIEKERKKTAMKIDLPRDWANLIRCVKRRVPINVIEMEQNQFLNFKSLLSERYVHRKENITRQKVPWMQIKWLQYRKAEPGKIFYKLTFEENEEFQILDISRRGRRSGNTFHLSPLYSGTLSLAAEKVTDLQALLPYIHQSSRCFYEKLVGNEETKDTLMGDEEDSDL